MSDQRTEQEHQEYEVLVVGAGPAGLSAALYLARFNRTVALFDTGQGRSTWHQTNRNFMGFPGGISSRELRERGCQQLKDYPQVQTIPHKIETIRKEGDLFIAQGQAGTWYGRAVILCTGVVDRFPHFDGWEEYVGRSMLWCILCDGYETIGKRLVVLGNNNGAAAEALQLQRFTDKIVLLTNSQENHIEPKFLKRLEDHSIPVIHDQLDKAVGKNGQFEKIITKGNLNIELDLLFNQQGATPQNKLALDLGVKVNEDGYVETNVDLFTNVPGVFAAGDITRLYSHQISTAVYEGGQAACAANYYLYPPDLKDD